MGAPAQSPAVAATLSAPTSVRNLGGMGTPRQHGPCRPPKYRWNTQGVTGAGVPVASGFIDLLDDEIFRSIPGGHRANELQLGYGLSRAGAVTAQHSLKPGRPLSVVHPDRNASPPERALTSLRAASTSSAPSTRMMRRSLLVR